MLNSENNASRSFVSPELKEWVPAEYEAGYAARFADAGMPVCMESPSMSTERNRGSWAGST
jgi:hypothetical protein